MKKRILSFILTLCMIVSMVIIVPITANAAAPTADYAWYGDGSATTFTLSDAGDLLGFANLTNGADGKTRTNFAGKTVQLAADITLNEGDAADWATTPPIFSWPMISYCTSETEAKNYGFNGVFDGKAHRISGVYINATSGYAAFFSSVANDTNTAGAGVVKNLYIVNSYIKGSGTSNTAGVACYVIGKSTIDKVYCDAIIDSTATAGGIVGRHNNSNYVLTISNCVFAGTINSTSYSNNAGMLGYAGGDSSRVTINSCINMGTISGNTHVAGITAGNSRPDAANIADCLNMGTINGTQYLGGIAVSKSYDISTCINVGNITATGSGAVGSIYGASDLGTTPTVNNCYYTVLDRAMASGSNNINEDSSAMVTNTANVTEGFLKTNFVDANYSNWTITEGEIPMPTGAKNLIRMSITLMTYNIRSIQLEDYLIFWQRPTYENRDPSGVVNTIIDQSPDVIGLQEVNYRNEFFGSNNWFDDYLTATGGLTQNGYTLVQGLKNYDDSYNPIFFKTERFELVSSGTYWLTATPTAVSRITGSEYYRFMTWAFLRDKNTGVVFMFVNTHLDTSNETIRQTQSQYLVQYVKALNTNNVAVFISGDFNSKYSTHNSPMSAASKVIVDDPLWKDAHQTAVTRVNDTGTEATGFTFSNRVQPVDLMFVPEENCVINRYEAVNNYVAGSLTDSSNLYSGTYPSDHLPVRIDLTLSIKN